jgi:hypothetical protein
MFANNKEYLNPGDYPKFIKNELQESKDIAIKIYLKNPGIISKHYFKLIFIYSSCCASVMWCYCYHSIYQFVTQQIKLK